MFKLKICEKLYFQKSNLEKKLIKILGTGIWIAHRYINGKIYKSVRKITFLYADRAFIWSIKRFL